MTRKSGTLSIKQLRPNTHFRLDTAVNVVLHCVCWLPLLLCCVVLLFVFHCVCTACVGCPCYCVVLCCSLCFTVFALCVLAALHSRVCGPDRRQGGHEGVTEVGKVGNDDAMDGVWR